ncbi:MAG: hypothetical protein ACJ77K_09190 [Bacteroidia bacterium]
MKTLVLFSALAVLSAACSKEATPLRQSEKNSDITIHYSRSVSNNLAYYFVLKNNTNEEPGQYRWVINGMPIKESGDQFRYKFDGPGKYTVSANSERGPAIPPLTISVE